MSRPAVDRTLNTAGTGLPLLLVRTNLVMQELAAGAVVEIIATHPDSETDIPSWCRRSGNTLVHSEVSDSTYRYYVRKHT
ncbi:MAG: sulfurtransferase TusA family protein [Gammaproteobacteria bacterium]